VRLRRSSAARHRVCIVRQINVYEPMIVLGSRAPVDTGLIMLYERARVCAIGSELVKGISAPIAICEYAPI
jgi:hypothetical protein